jgi:hypothetical protein
MVGVGIIAITPCLPTFLYAHLRHADELSRAVVIVVVSWDHRSQLELVQGRSLHQTDSGTNVPSSAAVIQLDREDSYAQCNRAIRP